MGGGEKSITIINWWCMAC